MASDFKAGNAILPTDFEPAADALHEACRGTAPSHIRSGRRGAPSRAPVPPARTFHRFRKIRIRIRIRRPFRTWQLGHVQLTGCMVASIVRFRFVNVIAIRLGRIGTGAVASRQRLLSSKTSSSVVLFRRTAVALVVPVDRRFDGANLLAVLPGMRHTTSRWLLVSTPKCERHHRCWMMRRRRSVAMPV